MAQYTYRAFQDVVDDLARRLYDPQKKQWVQVELESLLVESLRTWNALSQFWRAEFAFSLGLNTRWYDLRTLANTSIPCTVTQEEVITKVKRYLLEPPSPTSWDGSTQFSFNDLYQALQRRQDETLGQTACTIVRQVVNAPLVNRCKLDDKTIDIRRVVWMPTGSDDYSTRILKQSDSFAARAFNPGYTTAGQNPPQKWMQNTEPPPSFDVDYQPPVTGEYEVLVTQAGPAWESGANETLTMPDDWSWVFQFGAMADLFSREGLASDPLRAAYCRARYEEGIGLMRLMPVVLALRLNDKPLAVGAVTGGDRFNATWQSKAAGSPKSAYTLMNLLAFAPKPDSSTAYGATVTVCRNIPVNEPYIQVARDDLDTVVDYAQHLAMFKQGGQEFYQSIALYQNMQRKAMSYNGKLREMGIFSMPQLDLSVLEERSRNPRFQKGSEPKAVAAT